MSGTHTDKEKLNLTLEKVCSILNENNVNNWFIFFGTLLGIVRENSCIEGDNDLDIMIHYDYQKLRAILEKEGFKFTYGYGIRRSKKILKTEACDKYGSIDFYMCNTNEFGDFHTPWHGVISTDSYIDINNKSFIKFPWNNTVLNMPNNYEQKLINMYGDWKTPQSKQCQENLGKV
jgi:phosphorylcholine metabolism protein LicD